MNAEQLFWAIQYVEALEHIKRLDAMRTREYNRRATTTPTIKALAAGRWALDTEIRTALLHATRSGLLPMCFEGSKVVKLREVAA